MTVYKKYVYIYKALDSVLNQEYPDIELIVCDDCSGDFPEQDILDYIRKNKRENIRNVMVYSNEKNLGTVRNFNRAIKKASGFYFIGLAADDIFFDRNVMGKIVGLFDRTGACYATCRAAMKTEDRRNGLCFQTERDIKDIRELSAQELYDRITRDNIILGACTYFTYRAIEKFGYFDEQYVYIEDLPKFLAICRQESQIEFFDVAAIWHTMDGISNSRSVPERYLEDNLSICNREILAYRDRLSFLSYRYNLCRKKSLELRKESGGWLRVKDMMQLFFLYPDAVAYNIFVAVKRHVAKRVRLGN